MGIVTSTILENRPQADGSRNVVEEHVLDNGRRLRFNRVLAAGVVPANYMAECVPGIEAEIVEDNARRNRWALRASLESKKDAYIQALTDNQLRTVIGLTIPEVSMQRALERGEA